MEPRSTPGTSAGRRAPTRRLGSHTGAQAAGDLEKLRRLVVGPEQTRLDRLEQRPIPSSDTVGSVLPEAVSRASVSRGQELAIALEPVVATALRSVATQNTQLFAEILAPTIGAAVRKAVRDAIAAMMQRFNEALERSLSLESVKWRIEARRTKRPFAEVVLLRTLVYQVDQVFLIDSQSGLVLEHVSRDEGGVVQEPDQVASMLEAIDSFAREAFRPQPPGAHLSHVELGDLTIWVDRDVSLTVAAVVRGVAPREYGELLREARERIHLSYQAELARFQSDATPFAAARPELERCLQMQRRPPRRRAQIWLAFAAAVIVVVAGAVIARARTHAAEDARLPRSYVEALHTEPGIVVTSVERNGERLRIFGFRDPLAAAPGDVLARRGLSPAELSFAAFYSLDPQLIERRARQALKPPPGVTLTLQAGTLRARGTAPQGWIERTRLLAPALPGISRYDEHALQAEDLALAVRAAVRALESTEIRFARGSSQLTPGSAIVQARARLQQVLAIAAQARTELCIGVIGHADPSGSQQANRALSRQRAIRVTRELGARQRRPEQLRAIGAGVRLDAKTAAQGRSVIFKVEIGSSCREER